MLVAQELHKIDANINSKLYSQITSINKPDYTD